MSRWVVMSATCVLAGCGAGAGADAADETGRVEAALTVVPTGVACVRMVLSGSTTGTRNFNVAAGSASVLNLGTLSPGSLTIAPTAYNTACGSAGTSAVPAWVGGSLGVNVIAGLVTNIAITLRPNVSVTGTVDFATPAVGLAAGDGSTFAVMQGGSVRAWGRNAWGQLGDGTTTSRPSPVTLVGLASVTQVAAGAHAEHACALLADGTARCWGHNNVGQLGNGTALDSATPVAVTMPTGVRFRQIAVGAVHTCAVGDDGSLYCWGANANGQLGDGTLTSRSVPTRVSLAEALEVQCGSYTTCARLATGEVSCSGLNDGQFANGTTGESSVFVASRFGPTIGLSAGDSSACVRQPLGAVSCSGRNSSGELGDGTTTNRILPTAVVGLSGTIALSVGGSGQYCALRSDGVAVCWGGGGPQSGNGTTGAQYTPAAVVGLNGLTAVAVGANHTCALRNDGTVYCWGINNDGQVGDGTRAWRYTPVRVAL